MENNTRETHRQELIRLLKGLDFYREWRMSSLTKERVGVSQEELACEVVMPGSVFLQLFDETKGKRCTEVLTDIRAWYSHTASDLNWLARSSDEDRNDVRQFLENFRKEVGFHFHDEAGALRKLADRALKRGNIANEEEYYLLNELRNDLSQSILKAQELADVSALLNLFDGNAGAV
jgi:hypothetical protein